MKQYTIIYDAGPMSGEHGYWYEIRSGGRLLRAGWSRGKKHNAEKQARAELDAIERKAA